MKLTALSLAVAAALFPWVFRSRRGNFWGRMPLVAGGLGALSLLTEQRRGVERPRGSDLLTGIGTAVGLYLVFQVGDRLARAIMPGGDQEIARIYRLRRAAPRPIIALVLATIIAPAEELFWRGMVQNRLMRRFGAVPGTLGATAAYGLVHLGSGNLTLTGAAAVAGAGWGLQYLVQRRLPALIVSHILWDIWIFLIAPTPGADHPEAG
ncbi:MAG TPA: CPBP family intramembrane glutamic endopeptidase [Chloroflexota bacterium]|nr:CPBP family intramembrane glutamic endopeptidase [Chloroflexota bacterium]